MEIFAACAMQAIKAYKKVLKTDPENFEVWRSHGTLTLGAPPAPCQRGGPRLTMCIVLCADCFQAVRAIGQAYKDFGAFSLARDYLTKACHAIADLGPGARKQ
jgi:tetratricopeptide (TPR) repeat protein